MHLHVQSITRRGVLCTMRSAGFAYPSNEHEEILRRQWLAVTVASTRLVPNPAVPLQSCLIVLQLYPAL